MLNGSVAMRWRSVVGVFALTSSLVFVGLIANPSPAYASLSPVALGSASTYAVLGGTGVTSTGNTVLTGDLGVSPSASIVGFPLGVYSGSIHAGDAQAAQAQSDLQLAYNAAAALTPTGSFAGDQNGQTFDAGVYSTGAAFALTGTLTLDGQGNSNAVFVFQVNAALNTAASSSIHLINGARASNVFWQVNGAAGTGAPSSFTGTIMANGAITVGAGGSIDGRALSNGTVTLADNAITAPVPTATITSPGSGNTYTQGQVVPTGFTCADPNGPGISTCLDSDASTSPGALDTSATGPFTYSVTATSSDGQSATASIAYTVVAPNHTVTFAGNGSTGGATAAETHNAPTALTANGYSRTGYAFTGWNTSANGSGTGYADGATYAFGADATLYAQWSATPPTATITSPGSGNTYTQGQVVPTGFTCADPNGPGISTCLDSDASTSPGALDTSATGPFTYSVTATSSDGQSATASIAYTVVAPNHTVTFAGNGSTGGATAAETHNAPTALTANGYSRTGYAFTGWNTSANGSGTGYADGATYAFGADATLYAQWSATPAYSVTFSGNGSTGGSTATETTNTPSALNLNGFSSTGNYFTGWNTSANGSGTAYADGAAYAFGANVTLYAQWTANSPGGGNTAPPTITGISPASGLAVGGTRVTITGTNFTGANLVDFGSTAATNVNVVNSTTITVSSPAGPGGPDNVTVTTLGGTSAMSFADDFTYVDTITLIQDGPTSAAVADGDGYSGQCAVTNAVGILRYTETASADSADVVVSSTGAISAPSTLAPGTYSVSGDDGDANGDSGTWSFALTVMPTTPTTPANAPGYDLVGSDGGVFVFGPAGTGFYGSLPGIGVHVNDIVGMVTTTDNKGYYLVGSDGGVFAFGDATFFGSLPGMGIKVNNIVGMVATADNKGYYLVGRDGGVFAFGDAAFEGSLPELGIQVDNVVGIAATFGDQGYWIVGSGGQVYAFGDAKNLGSAAGLITAITPTLDGAGYWLIGPDGGVFAFGTAPFEGSLPGIGITVTDVVSLVTSAGGNGYVLIGRDGGVFAFGTAPFEGSLPGIGVEVTNIVGAVRTD
jgi:uncharacterized repeat protein (TIGR02543 family)